MSVRHVVGRVKDVFFDPARRVLDLRNSPALLRASDVVFPPGSFRHKHRRSILVSFFVLALVASLSFTKNSTASVATFYPSACSGGWKNASNAGGMPSLGAADPAVYFTSENSAEYVTGEDIVCSSFSGQIPSSAALPQRLIVSFRWSFDNGSITHVVPTPVLSEEGGVEVVEGSAPASEAVASTPEAPAPESIPESVPDVAPSPAPEPAPEPVIVPESAPEPVPESTPAPEVVPESSPTGEQQAFRSALAQSIANVFSVGRDSANTLLEARYSFDGATWKSLGRVTTTNWQAVSFYIDGDEIKDWSDVSTVHVGLFSVGSKNSPAVFLDSVQLDAQYEDATDFNVVPTVEVTDPTISIVKSEKMDFNLNESPTFHVIDPNLSSQTINDLVRDSKATVIKDDLGVLDGALQAQEELIVDASATDALATETYSEEVSLGASVISASSFGLPMFGGSQLFSALEDGDTFLGKLIAFLVPFSNYMLAFVGGTPPPVIDAVILDSAGEQTPIPVVVQRVVIDGVGQDQIVIEKPERMFRPGKYTLQVTLHTSEALVVAKQDFTWGVLAVNMDKSIYAPNDSVYVQMGVLNDLGHTICDADLTLKITSPAGDVSTLSTDGAGITREAQCGPDNVISVPDYYARFRQTAEEGVYTITLSATIENGTREVQDSFVVQKDAAFDVRRTGPTRIYPVSSYPVSMRITPAEDWSGTVIERVPANFSITPAVHSVSYDSMKTEGESVVLSWNLSLKKGEETTIGYYFTGPRISPEFYLLGPLEFYATEADVQNQTPVFTEVRQWQIADDAVCTATVSGVWNTTNTGSMWSGCTGTNGTPGTSDDVTINSGVTITLGAVTPAVNSLTVSGTLDTTAFNYTLNTKSLSVPSGGVLTANASVLFISGTTNSILSIVGTFNEGTSTIALTGGSTATTIPAISYYSLTINNSANTYLLTGTTTIDPAGVLNITNGTLNTTASNYALNVGKITMASAATAVLKANASTITLTGTSGTLFTKNTAGVFTADTSTIVVSGDGTSTVWSLNTFTFYNLVLSPVLTTNRTYTLGAAVTINGNFSVTPSGTGLLTVNMTSGQTTLTIAATKTFLLQPSGSATALFDTVGFGQSISTGVLDVRTNATLTLSAGSAVTLTGAVATPLAVTGTFNTGTSVITFNGNNAAGNTTIPSNVSYYSVTLNNASETYVLNGATTLAPGGTLTVTAGTFSTTGSNYALSVGKILLANSGAIVFQANASTITLTGTSGTLFSKNAATFTVGTSTFVFAGDASATLMGTTTYTFYNLVFSPTLTADRTYTFGAQALTINGNFSVTPSGTGLLTVNMTSGQTTLTIAATKTFLLQPSGSATALFDTVGFGQSISTGVLDVRTNATLTLSAGSAVTLTGAVATPLAVTGTFNTGTSVITFNGNNAAGNTTIPSNVSYYSITLNNTSETYVLNGTTTLAPGGTLTVSAGTFTTTASNYALTAGKLSIANTPSAIFTANASTITLNGTAGTLFGKTTNGVFTAGTSTLVFASDATVTLFGGVATVYNVTINPVLTTDRTHSYGAFAVTVNGDITINPSGSGALTVLFASGTSGLTVATTKKLTIAGTGGATGILSTIGNNFSVGTLDIEAGGVFTPAQSTVTLTGTNGSPFIMNGTFNTGTSTISYTGNNAAGNTTIATSLTYFNLTVNNSAEIYVLGGALTGSVGGLLNVTNGTFTTTASNYAITFGRITVPTSSATDIFLGNASTITLTGTTGTLFARSNTAVVTLTNSDIVISADGAPTLFTASGNYSIRSLTINPVLTADRVYSFSTPTLTISDSFTINPSAVSAATLSITLTSSGFTIPATGVFTIQASGEAQAYFSTGLSSPTLSVGSVDIEAGGTFANGGGSSITITGTTTTPFIQNGTFIPGNSTVVFTGTSTNAQIPATTFYNLTINKSGSMVLIGTTTVDVNGTLRITTGTLDTTAFNHSLIAGHIVLSGASSIFIENGSTITLTGTSGTLFSAQNVSTVSPGTSEVVVASASGWPSLLISGGTALQFHKLTIDSTATVINALGRITMSSVNAGNRLYVKRGMLSDAGVQIVGTLNGTIQVDAGAALCIGQPEAANATCNNGTSAGFTNFPSNYTNANILLDPVSTVYYNGNMSLSISHVPTYGNLTFAPRLSGSRVYTFTGPVTIEGNLTVAPALNSTGAYSVTLILGGATTVASDKTTLLQGGGVNPVSAAFDTKLGSNHAFSTGSLVIDSNSEFLARGSVVTVSKDWTRTGTFTQGTSTVVFTGSELSVVSGSTTFYNLTLSPGGVTKEIQFSTSGSPVFTVTNSFSATGSSGHLLSLYSDTPGMSWNLLLSGTVSTVSYLSIRDGACEGGSAIASPLFSRNEGNNGYCWSFLPFVQFSISDNTIGFGPLSSIAARFATDDASGSYAETEAHQLSVATSAPGGYTLFVQGSTLTRDLQEITAIGGLSTDSIPGSEQFGLRSEAAGGSGMVLSPYGDSGFAYDATGLSASAVASQIVDDPTTTVYSMRYVANINGSTDSGSYTTNLTYILTPNF